MAKNMTMTPTEFQEKHARRLKGAVQDIRTGIEKVTESPTAKAAAKETKMVQNLQAAVSSGKWRAGLNRVSLQQWKDAAINKGLNRIAAGVDGSKDKVIAFATDLLAHEASLQGTVNKMPDLTIEDSISRATAWIRGMSKFQRKG
jgi:predicted transcriptional regulator